MSMYDVGILAFTVDYRCTSIIVPWESFRYASREKGQALVYKTTGNAI